MGQYSKKGLYSAYKKNSKEREALDYYATDPEQVYNILNILKIDFNNQSILEPCCGGGHMIAGIQKYLTENNQKPSHCYGTEFKDRGFRSNIWDIKYDIDTLADDYPIEKADYIIANPPFSTIEPFTIRLLEIAEKGLIMLGRTQFTEGKGRYNNIFKDNPPTDIYQYIDRIECWKGGVKPAKSGAIQAYAWFVWDKTKDKDCGTQFHWIWR